MNFLNRFLKSKKIKHFQRTLKQLTLRDLRSIGKPPFIIHWWDIVRFRFTLPKTEMTLRLNKRKLTISDPYWFMQNFNEIFTDEVYKFQSTKDEPFIIDCGSNIGLSILYFKQMYPKAIILGFEPDPYLFNELKNHLASYRFQDVILTQKAVWKQDGTLRFHQDKSLGGRLIGDDSKQSFIQVQTIRLKDHLNQYVDFLKIDIEGAEYDVLIDCAENLENVENIFIEYHGQSKNRFQFRHLLKILEDSGFNYYIKEALPVIHPFIKSERKGGYELQYNIFGFRN